MKKKQDPIYDVPSNVRSVTVLFDDNTSHHSVVRQFVDGLVKAKYASRREVMDALEEYPILKANSTYHHLLN